LDVFSYGIIVEVTIQHTSYTSTNTISLMQEVPQGLRRMADRFSAWKEKKDADRGQERSYRGGGRSGFRGGGVGRRDWFS
jgi:hypothetical protein